ncbi:hypothetical protein E2320_020928 [Naja naja]|nr:hypothetical protein E2320_020928 [Naja naja]
MRSPAASWLRPSASPGCCGPWLRLPCRESAPRVHFIPLLIPNILSIARAAQAHSKAQPALPPPVLGAVTNHLKGFNNPASQQAVEPKTHTHQLLLLNCTFKWKNFPESAETLYPKKTTKSQFQQNEESVPGKLPSEPCASPPYTLIVLLAKRDSFVPQFTLLKKGSPLT